jgi:phospholipase C
MKLFLCLALFVSCQTNDDESRQIVLMSYNVMFVPKLLVAERDQLTRAHLLSKARFLRSNDILCLQEVFQPRPTEILLDSLTTTYPYRTPILGNDDENDLWDETWNKHVVRNSLKFLSGGLTLLSKWPIIHAGQYFYRHSCSGHTFVRVGFIYAHIHYGQGQHSIHVIGTHLQPDDHGGCYFNDENEIREMQMNEITGCINGRNISLDEFVFILGDFNVDRYNRQQYETMLDILHVRPQYLHSTSPPCTWDSSYNPLARSKHGQNQLLDYIFLHNDHTRNSSVWFNLVIDHLASDQWHLLGKDRMLFNTRNIPLMELSDHYPIVGFFNLSRLIGRRQPSGVLTYVQLFTLDTHQPVIINERSLRIGNSSNETGSLFILSNNGSPRRHRCLKSDQYIFLMDAYRPDNYLSDAKHLRMKYGMEQVHRYLKIIRLDNTTKCLESNSTFILQSRLRTGLFYVNSNASHLCSCAIEKDQAQPFRLFEVKRNNLTCTIWH